MKKFFTLLIVFLLWATSSWAQIQIGTGTASNALPINAFYGYTYSQNIYLASDINASGTITTLSFYFAGTSLTSSNNWTIYIGHTTKTAFNSSGTDWIPVGSMTQVYSAVFTSPTGPGWLLFDITDFAYNGTDNLVIAVDENASSYNGSADYFNTTAATTNRALRYYSDGTNPDPAAPPTGTVVLAYPNVILGGITMTPCTAPNQTSALSVTPQAYTSTALNGTITASVPAATGYLVVRYPTGSAVTAPTQGTSYTVGTALGLGTVAYAGPLTTFQNTGLTPNTTYDFYAYAYNNTMCGPLQYNLVSPAFAYGTTNPVQNSPSTAVGGLWSSPQTWVSGVVPTGENAVIAAGAVVTVDALVTVNALTVNGTLQWGSSSYAATVKGDLIINVGGKFLPYTTGLTGQTLNVGGNFTNDGYADLAVASTLLNFNGSTQSSSMAQVLGGAGTFVGDGTNGIIRSLFFQTLGSSSITTTQNLIITSDFAHTAGALNTNGKLTIDNTAQVWGQALNSRVANVAVTNMGVAYTTSPVVFGNSVNPRVPGMTLVSGTRYFAGSNVYLCTAGGQSAFQTLPTFTGNTTFADSLGTLLYLGTLGTLGNPYTIGSFTQGTFYFYDNNLYVATGSTNAFGTTGPTHTSGLVNNLLWVGNPAKVSVNWDATSATVRSLNLVQAGSGYLTAPALTFSNNGSTPTTTASATVVFIQQIAGATNSRTQKGSLSTISGGLNIVSNNAVGGITTANGGINYATAPLVGFFLPNNINLVTAQGSGYTAAPTVTISGGTNINGGTNPTITVVAAGGKVVSAYVTSNGTALWTSLPTLVFAGGGGGAGATLAFPTTPTSPLPTATANLTNGSITSFTITNAGWGYDVAPTPALYYTGTVTTAASSLSSRIGLYNLVYGYYAPATTTASFTEGVEVPANRRIQAINFGPYVFGTFTGNLELYGSSPILTTPLTNNGLIDLGSNTVTFSHRSYAGVAGSATFGFNGIITMTSPGGSVTRTFPYDAGVAVATGTGSGGTGSSITTLTASRTTAPTGIGSPIGTRAYRIQTNGGAYGTAPNITLNWNAFDALLSTNDSLKIVQSTAQSGPWTRRSTFSGTATPVGATGSKTTATTTPGPINADEYFAWGSGYVAPPALSYSIERTTGETYSSIITTGTNYTWSTTDNDDGYTAATPIPNSRFMYQGDTIKGFGVGTNGLMKMYSTKVPYATACFSYNTYNNFSAAGNNYVVSAFMDDLTTNPFSGGLPTLQACMKYKIVGSSPGSRQIIAEWNNITCYGAAGPSLNYQVVLDETDNSIKFNYGLFQGFNGTNNYRFAYSCGMSGAYVSSFPRPGEVLAQQYENTDAFSNQFAASPYGGAADLMSFPECNSSIKFTPGTYAGLVVPPQTPPVNDDAANAIEVPALTAFPANLCGNFYTSRFATPSSQAVCAGDAGDDVWFKFQAQEPVTTVRVYGSGGYKARVQVLDASLNPLPAAMCVVAASDGASVDANLTNLSPSQWYYVRVYHNGGGIQATATASISGGMVTGLAITNPGTGYSSTPDNGTPNWSSDYYGTARVRITGGGGTDATAYCYVPTSPGPITGLYIGSGGYGYTSAPTVTIESPSWAQIGEFAIVVYASAPNDDCAGAVDLTGLGTPGCNATNSKTYNTLSATPSTGIPGTTCGTPDDDVWYKFTATNTNTRITVSGTGTFDPAFQVFDGGAAPGACGSLASVICVNTYSSTTEETVLQTTTIGNTYFVRVYHAGAGSAISSTFTICVTSATPACITAPTFPVNAGYACVGAVTLSWPAGTDVTKYMIYLNTGSGLTLIDSTTALTYTTAALAVGSYSWKIVPKNAFGLATGCSEWTFTIAALPTVTVEPSSASFCPGQPAAGPITAYGGATYEWLPVAGIDAPTSGVVHASPGATTVYTVTGTDLNGCTASAAATINVAPIISASASADPTIICNGGSTVLAATASSGSGAYCTTGPTTYHDCGADEYIANVTFGTINNTPVCGTADYQDFTAQSTTIAAGATGLALTVENPNYYSSDHYSVWIDWNQNGDFTDAGEEYIGTDGGPISTFSISVPASAYNGMTRMRVRVTYSSTPAPCGSELWGEVQDYSVIVTGGVPPPSPLVATYNWMPGGLIGSPVTVNGITTTTTYTVTASAAGYCPGTATATVSINALNCAALTTSGTNTCIGNQSVDAHVTGGGAPYTYSWTEDGLPVGGNTASILAALGKHLYVCNVTDFCNNTCSSSDSVLTRDNPTVGVLPATSDYCTPGGTPAFLSASGALGYDWTPLSGLSIYSGSETYASPTATTVYTVVGTDTYGCSASATATVNVVKTLLVTATADPSSTCLNGSSILTANGTIPSTLTYCVPVQSGSSCVSGVIFNTLNSIPPGCVSPYYHINPATGANTTSLTPGTTYALTVNTDAAAITSVWIDYNNDGIFDASEWNQLTTTAATATINITIPLTATNAITGMRIRSRLTGNTNGAVDACTVFGSGSTEDYFITIGVPPAPPSITYSWNPGGLSGSPVTVSPVSATTTYTVTANAPGYCPGVGNVTVTVEPLTCGALTVGGATACEGIQTLTAHVTGGGLPYTYSWTKGGLPYGGNTATITTAVGDFEYICTVTDGCSPGNTCSSTINLNTNPNPVMVVTPNPGVYCAPGGTAALLTASGADLYLWTPSTGLNFNNVAAVNASPAGTITYTVTGTTNSCTGTTAVTVNVGPNFTLTPTVIPDTIEYLGAGNLYANLGSVLPSFYSFAVGTGATLDPMTGATTVVASGVDDYPMCLVPSSYAAGPSLPLPFPISVGGTAYTYYSASPDGWIALSNSAAAASSSFSNGVTLTSNVPKFYPYWDDVATGTDGNVKVFVEGSSPDQIFIVQWFVTIPRNTTGAANSTFQAWFYESTGVVEYRYGTMNSASMSASGGITGLPATNFNSITFATNTSSAGAANDANAVQPVAGTIYTYTVPVPAYEWTPGTFLSSSTEMNPTILDAYVTTTYTVTANYGGCSSPATITVPVRRHDRLLDLRVFIEGIYTGSATMKEVLGGAGPEFPGYADAIHVEMHDALTPFDVNPALVYDTVMGLNGYFTVTIPAATTGFYYIVVKHRNGIETWSADPYDFTDPVPTSLYDFTSDATQAYGANLKNVGGLYAIWSGDVNQDGVVDGSDLASVDNDNSVIATGYLVTDVNGDGVVDGSDLALVDNNNANIIQAMKP